MNKSGHILAGILFSATTFADNCDKPRDDFDGVYCQSKIYQEADQELNLVYEDLRNYITQADKVALRKTQIQWINARNAECGLKKDKKFYVSLGCTNAMTVRRTNELRDLIRECKAIGCQSSKLSRWVSPVAPAPAPEKATHQQSSSFSYKKDDFQLPEEKSTLPHRFLITTGLNGNDPVDRLDLIQIGPDQDHLNAYVKITGVEANGTYGFRLRVLDAKQELLFDKEMKLVSKGNSVSFSAQISPHMAIDQPGEWTFQGILNGQLLFAEKRGVLY